MSGQPYWAALALSALLLSGGLASSAETQADDLSGAWSASGGTRLVLSAAGAGAHSVRGHWASRQVEGQAQVKRLLSGEGRLALRLQAGDETIQTVWALSRDRTVLARGSVRLRREVSPGFVRLKVMTYNIKGIKHLGKVEVKVIHGPGPIAIPYFDVDANDVQALVRFLRAEQPDVLALQEVDRIKLPSVDSEAETVAKDAGYDFRYAPATVADIDLPGPFSVGREHGNALLIRRRQGLKLAGSRIHELPRAVSGEESRNALQGDLQVAAMPLRLLSTHLTYDNMESRLQQAGRLAKLLSGPTVLLGDLNAQAGAPELAPLAGRCVDAFEAGYAGGPRASFGPSAQEKRIDHILLCGTGGRVLSSWIAGHSGDAIEGFSDHRPVLSVIEVPSETRVAREGRHRLLIP